MRTRGKNYRGILLVQDMSFGTGEIRHICLVVGFNQVNLFADKNGGFNQEKERISRINKIRV